MRSRSGITIALIALLLFVALPSLANLYTEWLWFGEVGYQSIFLKSLTTKGLIGSVGFLIAFVVLYANLRFATKEIHRPYVLFAGGGDLQPLVLERSHVGVLAIGVSALVALFVGSVASSQWMLVLRYFEATPFGEVDPLFGLDASFYIFALPFYDFLRFSALSLIVLALSGSVGAYAVSYTHLTLPTNREV